MGLPNDVDDVSYRIKNLRQSYSPNGEGGYLAGTENKLTFSINKICAAIKNRDSYNGSYDNLVENIKQFLYECAYQLCDGYAVNMKYYSIHPNISKTLAGDKNPVNLKLRALRPLNNLIEHITVEIADAEPEETLLSFNLSIVTKAAR